MKMKTVREVIRRDGKHEEPKSESGMQQNTNEIVSSNQHDMPDSPGSIL